MRAAGKWNGANKNRKFTLNIEFKYTHTLSEVNALFKIPTTLRTATSPNSRYE